jgi:hypothetical protein
MAGSLQRIWQKINAYCHFCHWWQDREWRSITAMTFLMIFVALAVLASVATLRDVFGDRGPAKQPPTSHFEDPTFRAPAARI